MGLVMSHTYNLSHAYLRHTPHCKSTLHQWQLSNYFDDTCNLSFKCDRKNCMKVRDKIFTTPSLSR